MSGGDDRTEAPTGKRLAEAKRNGQWGRTPDLATWAGLGAGFLTLPACIKIAQSHVVPMFASLSDVAAHPDPARMTAVLSAALPTIGLSVAPIAGTSIAVAVVAATVQGGFKFTTKPLKPDFSRLKLNLAALKRYVDPTQAWQLGKSLLKMSIIAIALAVTIRGLLPALVGGAQMPLGSVIGTIEGGIGSLVRTTVVAGIVLAVVDYVVAQRKLKKDLKMTKQQVKDEHKNAEGNPEVKNKIRGKALERARQRSIRAVPTADVLLVNPTHVAVALKYEPGRGAPRVVAKGAGHVAAKLRALASEHAVPVVSDVPLARALYAACELDEEIPNELFVAVAQVLAFVMALRKRGGSSSMGGGVHSSPVKVALPETPLSPAGVPVRTKVPATSR